MKLCASNIAWTKEYDEIIYKFMSNNGFSGIETTPSRYENVKDAENFALSLKKNYDLEVVSMQSIFYGINLRIAENRQERKKLDEYMNNALILADVMNCRNIVFGCPKNRKINSTEEKIIVEEFLINAADNAKKFGIIIAFEANPKIYDCNFINTTSEAFELLTRINHPNLRLNLDFGTIIENHENLAFINKYSLLINHVHISEPYLEQIKPRKEHQELREILEKIHYDKYISIEMKKQEINQTENIMKYIRSVFA